jgi:drug/metabolite transporter (DMT)-like permease
LWGATPIATSIAVRSIDPSLAGVLRTIVAAAVAAPLAVLLRLSLPRDRKQWLLLLASALGGFVLFPIFYSWGVKLTSASHSALLIAILPVITVFIVSAVQRRSPRGLWWLGAALALLGEWILIRARAGVSSTGSTWLGDVLILLACISASAGYVAGSRLSSSQSSLATTLWGVTLGGVLLLPLLALLPDSIARARPDAPAIAAIVFLGILSTIVGYLLWYWALAHGGVSRVGFAQFVQPLVSVVLAMLVLGETINPLAWLAAACIACGVAVAHDGSASLP